MQQPSCSLVASTYNWPEALRLLLLSVKAQSVFPDEVIIADDGSTHETKELIAHFQKDFPIPLHHVWQEDKGNRKAMIMNKAIAKAKGDYIIEIDGDIIMHKHFVKDHLHFAEKGQYLFGSRVTILKQLLPKIFETKKTHYHFFSKGIKKRGRTLHIPFMMRFQKPVAERSRKMRGCNISFWKSDFIKINGYNEAFEGWGMEDYEMAQRLHNNGVKGRRLKHAGIVYHIYHKEQSKNSVSQNSEIERMTTEENIKAATKGIDQYL